MVKNIVVAGAGHAGGRCALQLRNKGFDGNIILVGKEAYPPYERPPLSKDLLLGQGEFGKALLVPHEKYEELGIDLTLGDPIVQIDTDQNKVSTQNNQAYAFDKLVIATGGNCRVLNCSGSNLQHIYVLRDWKQCQDIRSQFDQNKKLVIVGGGFIGLEVAASASQSGCIVTVIEREPYLLSRVFPQAVSEAIQSIHEKHGVNFIFGQGVSSFEGAEAIESVTLESGNILEADIVVVGVGIEPDTALAAEAGLTVENGIKTNQFCQTDVPEIYAIGDCSNSWNQRYGKSIRLESWQNAEQHADIVANHIVGTESPLQSVPWFWSDQFDYNVQMAGFPMDSDTLVRRGELHSDAVVFIGIHNQQLLGAISVGKGMSAAKDLRVLQKLMERDKTVIESELTDSEFPLKTLLKR